MLAAVHLFASGVAQSDDITVFAIDCASWPAAGDWSMTLRVPEERARLPELLTAIEDRLQAAGTDASCIHDAQLIVEELVCNLMDHGAPAGVDTLRLGMTINGDRVTLDIRDNGPAYDPLAHPAPDLDADVDARPIGGLGIHLVRELAQDARYQREGSWNHVRVVLGGILPPS